VSTTAGTIPTSTTPTTSTAGTSPEALTERLSDSMLGALDVLSIYLGDQLGLYPRLVEHWHTPTTLAAAAGIDERYAREWLEQQAVVGLLEVEDPAAPEGERRYRLPAGHAEVLAEQDNLNYLTPFARVIGAAAVQLPALVEAYRTGAGVGWEQYGEAMRTGQAEANRPLFLHELGASWLPSLPGVHETLTAGGRVADIGCGEGWSTIAIALAYPASRVDGIDVDEASVVAARAHAEQYGVADRVTFHLADAAAAEAEGGYDLVTAFECVHDLPDPVGVLASMRRLAGPGAPVLVMDERVAEQFAPDGDFVERLMYGISLLVCLPDGLSHPGSVGTGTVMRPDTLRRYATEAGFEGVDVLPIEHDLFRFYSLRH
jgi:2-polyprenyl-3-methyl-5-hydroxy-6-metoxy-1,4-benzoquinol methylase